MNRLLILGNGFDLAMGLPTSYMDFMEWYFNNKVLPKINFGYSYKDNIWDILIKAGIPIPKSVNKEEIVGLYRQLYKLNLNKTTAQQSLLLTKILEEENQFWIDIEQSYYDLLISYKKNNSVSQVRKLNDELSGFEKLLVEYLENITKDFKGISPLSHNHILKDYSPERLTKRPTEKYSLKIENLHILNFNYTPTAYILANELTDISKVSVEVNHIHGQINNESNPIIFGFGDEFDQSFTSLKNARDDAYVENIKSYKYQRADRYKNLNNFVEHPFEIFIFGHSCGASDRVLLKSLFQNENCVSITPIVRRHEPNEYFQKTAAISRNFSNMQLFRDKIIIEPNCPKI